MSGCGKPRRASTRALGLVLSLLLFATARRAGAEEAGARRPRMPEPLLLDSTTDIDSDDAGELEIDLLGAAARGGSAATIEAEWRGTQRLGISLQLQAARGAERDDVGASAVLSWALHHQDDPDLHLQAFARLRIPFTVEDDAAILDPADPVLPASAGIQGAIRRGVFTVRSELAAEAGGGGPHRVSARGGAALILGGRAGFAAAEILGDLARSSRWTLAAEASAAVPGLGLPLRLGVAVPWELEGHRAVALLAGLVVDLE